MKFNLNLVVVILCFVWFVIVVSERNLYAVLGWLSAFCGWFTVYSNEVNSK